MTNAELMERFIEERGYWNGVWDELLEADPGFFAAYLDFSAHPSRRGVLDPKVRELIYIAIDAATTHLYLPGLRVHVRNALGHGATADEIMEVLQLTSVLGIHTITEGVPVLLDEVSKAGKT